MSGKVYLLSVDVAGCALKVETHKWGMCCCGVEGILAKQMWQWWLSSKLGSRVDVGAGKMACGMDSKPESKVAKRFLTKLRSCVQTRHMEELECT
eukprot:5237608-Amphidinium_carterae.1